MHVRRPPPGHPGGKSAAARSRRVAISCIAPVPTGGAGRPVGRLPAPGGTCGRGSRGSLRQLRHDAGVPLLRPRPGRATACLPDREDRRPGSGRDPQDLRGDHQHAAGGRPRRGVDLWLPLRRPPGRVGARGRPVLARAPTLPSLPHRASRPRRLLVVVGPPPRHPRLLRPGLEQRLPRHRRGAGAGRSASRRVLRPDDFHLLPPRRRPGRGRRPRRFGERRRLREGGPGPGRPGLAGATRVVGRSPWLGFPPVATSRSRAASPAASALRAALLGMSGDEAGRGVLHDLRLDGFVEGQPAAYDPIAAEVATVRAFG